MFAKVNVLQLGPIDLSKEIDLNPCVEWLYEENIEESEIRIYDVVLLTRPINENERYILFKKTKAHCLFVEEDTQMNEPTEWICHSKLAKFLNKEQMKKFLQSSIEDYYSFSYGEKFKPQNLNVKESFKGTVQWDGYSDLTLSGDFGQNFTQAAFWRYNIPIQTDQSLDFWLEYEKIGNIELELRFTLFVSGSTNTVQEEWNFSEENLQNTVTLTNKKGPGILFVSIHAKGEGTLKIIALHNRYSRRGKGVFLPGGIRCVTKKREEVFFYFDPGDMKPPLNVYFSGYKTQEGFEGYYMMKKLGAPFLLVSDSRLEGGDFYIGDEEYEENVKAGIQHYLNELGFTSDQLVLSGLSMGTFGALYYGCDFQPHSIIVGKPLASLGDIATNERINRPGGFSTSLDILWKESHDLEDESIKKLNDKFWNKFDSVDWKDTKFIVSYMIEDDYDSTAYQSLLKHIKDDKVEIYSKGLHGRHNDNTSGIVQWFVGRYNYVLNEDFKREFEDK